MTIAAYATRERPSAADATARPGGGGGEDLGATAGMPLWMSDASFEESLAPSNTCEPPAPESTPPTEPTVSEPESSAEQPEAPTTEAPEPESAPPEADALAVEATDQAEAGAEGAEGADAAAEGEGEAEAEGEEEVEAEGEGQGEAEGGETSAEPGEAAGGGQGAASADAGGGEAQIDGLPALIPPKPARLGGTDLPSVEPPPRMDERATQDVVKRTGRSPDENHDQVRAAARRLSGQLHAAQVEVVRRVEWIGADLRQAVEGRAQDVLALAGGYAAQIRAAVKNAKDAVGRAATTAHDEISNAQVTRVGDMGTARQDADRGIFRGLETESEGIGRAVGAMRTAHAALSSEFRSRYTEVGRTGADPGGAGQSSLVLRSPIQIEGDAIKQRVLDARGEGTEVEQYQLWQISNFIPPHADQKAADAVDGATRRGQSVTSDDMLQTWAEQFLGMGNSTVAQAAQTAMEDNLASEAEVRDQRDAIGLARRTALAGVTGGEKAAKDSLDEMGDRMVKSLYEAAHKARKALDAQAQQGENVMRELAPGYADQWRGLAAQAREQIPRGTLLDATRVVPQLRALEKSAKALKKQQIDAAEDQSRTTRAGVEEAIEQYRKSFQQIVEGAQNSSDDAARGAAMELAAVTFSFTGTMTEGTRATVEAARLHAEEVVAEMDTRPGRVEEAGRTYINTEVRKTYERQLGTYVNEFANEVRSLERQLQGGLYGEVRGSVNNELEAHARAIDNAMPEEGFSDAIGLGEIFNNADESAVITQITTVPTEGRRALREYFNAHYGWGVGKQGLGTRMRAKLSDQERSIAENLLEGTAEGNTAAAALALQNETSWWGIDASARDAVVRSLNGQELGNLAITDGQDATVQRMLAGLDPHELRVNAAYGDQLRVAQFTRDLDQRVSQAREQGDEASARAIGDLESQARTALGGEHYAGLITRQQAQGFLTDVYQEHAAIEATRATPAGGGAAPTLEQARADASNLTDAEARTRFGTWATRTYETTHTTYDPETGQEHTYTVRHELSAEARQAITANVNLTATSSQEEQDAAWASRARFEIQNAERQGMGDEDRRLALTRALDNPAFNRAYQDWQRLQDELPPPDQRTPDDRERLRQARQRYESLRQQQETRMGVLGRQLLGAQAGETPSQLQGPGGATAYVGQRLGDLWQQVDSTYGRDYGRETALYGRADLHTASMLAMGGHSDGTDEGLLRQAWTGRTQREIREADARYASETAEGDRDWFWTGRTFGSLQERVQSEVSGDTALEMEELALGEPETEADHVQRALLRYQHQRIRGTGWMASLGMSGTPEAQNLDSARDELEAQLRDELPPDMEAIGPDGMLTPEALAWLNNRQRDRERTQREQARADQKEIEAGRIPTSSTARDTLDVLRTQDLTSRSEHMGLMAQSYRAEVDRQEAMWMSAIQALGVILSVVLLLIPGVNIVAAGILSALITGMATIMVKSGFRGERYGWEEMAQDIGQTAIEMGTAWAGGKLAGSMANTVRNAVIRGALTQGMSSMASKAIDDNTWRNGLGTGIGRVLVAGGRGAITGAVSEGLSAKFNSSLAHDLQGANVVRGAGAAAGEAAEGAGKAGARAAGEAAEGAAKAAARPVSVLGTAWREGWTSAVGMTLGEAGGTGLEALFGEYHGTWGDFGRHLATTFGRELVSGFARGAIQGRQARQRDAFHAESQRLIDRGTPPTEAELAGLRRLGRSAGMGGTELGRSLESFDANVKIAQAERVDLLGRLPEGLRANVEGLPNSALREVHAYIDAPTQGKARQELLRSLRARGAGDMVALARGMDAEAASVAKQRAEVAAANKKVRGALVPHLPDHLRAAVGDFPSKVLSKLPPEGLRLVAETVRAAIDDPDHQTPLQTRKRLMELLKGAQPDADVRGMLRELDGAIEVGRKAQAEHVKARRDLIKSLPESTRRAVGALPEPALKQLRDLMSDGDPGTPRQRAALEAALKRAAPHLDTAEVLKALDAGVARTRAARRAGLAKQRSEREAILANLPKRLRGPLSDLPEAGLKILRDLASQDKAPSPQLMAALVRMARVTAPDLDVGRLRGAVNEAVALGQRQHRAEQVEQRALRKELLAGAPAALARSLSDVPILRVGADELASHTGLKDADAAVVVVEGRPVLLVRDGADPRAMREMANRVLQLRDPAWATALRALDESTARDWGTLSLREQIEAWHGHLRLEVDSHRRLIQQYESAAASSTGAAATALHARATELRVALAGLEVKLGEIEAMGPRQRADINQGRAPRPGLLDGPPRLARAGQPATGAQADAIPPRSLAVRLGQMEAEAKRALVVSGTRVEQGVDAAGNLMVKPDGTPDGYHIEYGFKVRTYSDGVTEIRVPMYLEPGKGVTPEGLLKVQRNAQKGIEAMYAGRFNVPGPDGKPTRLRVTLDFVEHPSQAMLHVKVKRGDGQAFQNQWHVDGDPITHAHEISHQLGLVDEYADHGPWGWKAANRKDATSPGVFTDRGLMTNYWIGLHGGGKMADPNTRVHQRYINHIVADIQSARAAAGPSNLTPTAAPAGPRRVAAGPDSPPPVDPVLKAAADSLRESLPEDLQKKLQDLPDKDLLDLAPVIGVARVFMDDPEKLIIFLKADQALRGLPLADTHVHYTSLLRPEHVAAYFQAVLTGGRGSLDTRVATLKRLIDSLVPEHVAKQGDLHKTQAQEALDRYVAALKAAPEGQETPAVRAARRDLNQAMRELTSLPMVKANISPQLAAFFDVFQRVKNVGGKADAPDALVAALQEMMQRGVRHVELRGHVRSIMEIFTGQSPNFAGAIFSPARGPAMNPKVHQRLLELAKQFHQLLGFDISGQEFGGKTEGTQPTHQSAVEPSFRVIATRNLEVLGVALSQQPHLQAAIASHPSLATALKAIADQAMKQGTGEGGQPADPAMKGLHEWLSKHVGADGRITDPAQLAAALRNPDTAAALGKLIAGNLDAVGLVNRFNRALREALEDHGASVALAGGDGGTSLLPRAEHKREKSGGFLGLLGTTVHAGEQVASQGVTLRGLLSDIDLVLRAGVDRIGHGVILGVPLIDTVKGVDQPNTAMLTRLGFAESPAGSGIWARGEGSGVERVSLNGTTRPASVSLRELDTHRKELLARVVREGVTIEINPTSNLVLNGLPLDEHPIRRMLLDAPRPPPLRVSVNTDNPGIHMIDVRSEMAFLLATGAITWPHAVFYALEGYASRLGSRPLPDAGPLAADAHARIVAETRTAGDRQALLGLLADRFPGVRIPDGASFEVALQIYLRRVFQGHTDAPPTVAVEADAPK